MKEKDVDTLAEKFYNLLYNEDLVNFWKLKELLNAVAFAIHEYTDEDEEI